MAEFKVGDEVVAQPPYGGVPYTITRVAKVGAAKITLQDGTEWSAKSQYRWGSTSDRFGRDRLEHVTERHRAEMRRRNALLAVRQINWDQKPTELLEQIAALVKSQIEPQQNQKG